jgi:hypothetical protein
LGWSLIFWLVVGGGGLVLIAVVIGIFAWPRDNSF